MYWGRKGTLGAKEKVPEGGGSHGIQSLENGGDPSQGVAN